MKDETMQVNTGSETPALLTVREAYLRLRISKWKLYDLIRTRLLGSVRIGRRRFIPADRLRDYVQQLQKQESFV